MPGSETSNAADGRKRYFLPLAINIKN